MTDQPDPNEDTPESIQEAKLKRKREEQVAEIMRMANECNGAPDEPHERCHCRRLPYPHFQTAECTPGTDALRKMRDEDLEIEDREAIESANEALAEPGEWDEVTPENMDTMFEDGSRFSQPIESIIRGTDFTPHSYGELLVKLELQHPETEEARQTIQAWIDDPANEAMLSPNLLLSLGFVGFKV